MSSFDRSNQSPVWRSADLNHWLFLSKVCSNLHIFPLNEGSNEAIYFPLMSSFDRSNHSPIWRT